jgi:hypothetical protein
VLTWHARRCGRGRWWGRSRASPPGTRPRRAVGRRGLRRSAPGRPQRRLPQAFSNGHDRGGRGARSTCGPARRRASTATSCRPCAGTGRAPAPCCCGTRSTGSQGPSLHATHKNKALLVIQTGTPVTRRSGKNSCQMEERGTVRDGKRCGPKEEAARLFQMGSTRCTGTGAPAAK